MNDNPLHYVMFWKDSDKIAVHKFTLEPKPEDNRYRAQRSYNATRDREMQKLRDGKEFRFRMHLVEAHQFATGQRFEEILGAQDAEFVPTSSLPVFEHASIWDMYKAVGYDYKKKRYVRTD